MCSSWLENNQAIMQLDKTKYPCARLKEYIPISLFLYLYQPNIFYKFALVYLD